MSLPKYEIGRVGGWPDLITGKAKRAFSSAMVRSLCAARAKTEAGRFALDQGQADSRKRPEQMIYPGDLLVMFMQLLHPAALFPQIEPGTKIFAFAANHQNSRTPLFVELAKRLFNGTHHL
jgi:hypothetical protein